MPEGHTLHRLARAVTAAFAGRTVAVSSPQGRFADSAALLDGSRLQGAEAWGKHLVVAFEGDRYVHIHLGLYGTFPVRTGITGITGSTGVPAPVGQVRLRLVSDGPPAAYADLRGPTACELLTAAQRDEVVAASGPDPLRPDADWERAWERISRSRGPIGGLLMDQRVLAGVGNIYRAELLFRHRLDPLRPGRTLRRAQFRAMWEDLVVLMADGVRTGRIDTVRPEHLPEAMGREPRADDHGGEVYVYRRHGQPCHACGAKVRTSVLQGRNLFWCPRCQPRFRSRAAG